MSSGDVVCTGWLIKSPPEKKLKRYVSAEALLIYTYVYLFFFAPQTDFGVRSVSHSSLETFRLGPSQKDLQVRALTEHFSFRRYSRALWN